MIEDAGKDGVRHRLQLRAGHRYKSQIEELSASRLLLTVGQAVYEFEEALKRAQKHSLEIEVPKEFIDPQFVSPLTHAMERVLYFVLLTDAKVSIVPSTRELQTSFKGFSHRRDALCLFSGGVDSISGTLIAANRLRKVSAAFCSHLYHSRVISITRQLADTYLQSKNIDLYEIPGPPMKASGYSQTRGLLYVLAGAAVAIWRRARKVVVSECGPTMFQPKFCVSDQTTMTTHPFIMDRAQEIIKIVSPNLKIVKPFENYTKAEVMALCPKPESFPDTHSCISQRLKIHDGTCYGCIIRRLASIASCCPDVEYASDPIRDPQANCGNLVSLLNFCVDFLASPRRLPIYQKDMIFGNRKGPLFKRFSLDNVAALYRLKSGRKRLAPVVDAILGDAITVLGGTAPLQERLAALEEMKRDGVRIRF